MHATSSTPPEVTVGIDVSKVRLDAHVEPTGAARSFDNDKCGRRALRNWALREGAGQAALEPTARYHRALHQCLADAGIEVVVVNPRRTRNFAHSIGKEAKNDLTDAEVLAVFARLQLGEASEPRPRRCSSWRTWWERDAIWWTVGTPCARLMGNSANTPRTE